MPLSLDKRKYFYLIAFVFKWIAINLPLGVAVGSAVAFFLWSLDRVTVLHWQNPWLLYLLPVAGIVSGSIYHFWGKSAEAGNNLIIEQIHEPSSGVPLRMAPLVLIGTLVTHLFGGSAGREGTAVQMGGSLAGSLGRLLKLNTEDTRILLMSGIAAGFGAVFGTPVAGAIFALEVLATGRMSYQALVPCIIASVIGDQVNAAWGIEHTHFEISFTGTASLLASSNHLNWLLMVKVLIAAVVFGMVSILFVKLTHALKWTFNKSISIPWLRPVAGGIVVVVLVFLLGDRDYLGLGVIANPMDPQAISIQSSFQVGGADWLSWWWKLLFTAITVGSGFKGGEVTPLFFVGATLGNILGVLLGAPVGLMAGLGFVAVFAGATKTPLACTVMAVELFAPNNGALLNSGFVVYAAVACFLSYLISGRSSIYSSQRPVQLSDIASRDQRTSNPL